MHVRVVSGLAQPGMLDQIVELIQGEIVPAARCQPGFMDMLVLVDPVVGRVMTVGLWETEADLRASETTGYLRTHLAKAAPYFAGPPAREIYELHRPE